MAKEQSLWLEWNEKRKIMETALQGNSQAMTAAVSKNKVQTVKKSLEERQHRANTEARN